MKAPWKAAVLLIALMVLSSLAPALPAVEPADGDGAAGEDRQDGSPLAADDAQVQYAILTSSLFVDEFQRLAEWKTEKGVRAKVYSKDWVTNHYPGHDRRAQVHDFLRDLFNHTDGQLRYLLIGADGEILRAREIHTGIKSGWERFSGEWVYSDHYYAGLDHDWDADGDRRYGELGETDWDPEIAVGRAPVSNLVEAKNVTDKLLAYERDPEVGDWMRTAVLAASVMNPPNANITNAHSPDHIYKWWEDNAWESLNKTIPLIPGHMDKHILYDYNQIYGGNYTPDNDTLDKQSYLAAMNMGSSIFVSVTHGWIPSGNGTPHYTGDGVGFNWSSAFHYTDIPYLTNGNQTPFIYFSSCYVGNFSEFDDSNYERLLTKGDGGAIGFIAPLENTYRGEEIPGISDGNWWMSENFWRNMLTGVPRPGDAFYGMIADYEPHLRDVGANPDVPYYRQNHAAYNLVGDPEMPIWLDVPKDLTLRLPTNVYNLEYDVPVRVTHGAVPVEGARVCFKGEDFYAFADTNGTGWASLHVAPGTEGQSVTVTATAPQHLPYQTTLGISPTPAELTVTSQTIRATTTSPEAGVPTELRAEVRNIGQNDALSFSVAVYDGDPDAGGTLIGEEVDVPGLPAGTSATVTVDWPAPSSGWHDIHVMADSADDIDEVLEDNNVGMAQVYISGINARANQVEVEGAGGGTALPIHTESAIAVHVGSTGSEALSSVTVRLYLGHPDTGGRPVSPDRTATSLAPGSSRVVVFPFTPTQGGTFRLTAVVDPDDELREFDELDNEAELWVLVGHPPFWTPIQPIQMREDADKEMDLTRFLTDHDTDMDDLEVSILSITTTQVNVTFRGKVLRIDPDPDWAGYLEVEVEVTDGNFSDMTTIEVLVEPSNDAPRFRGTGGNSFQLEEGERFQYAFDVYDPDGDAVDFSDNSELFDISPDGVIDFTPTYDQILDNPVHVFRVIATDGTAQSYFPMTIEFSLKNTPPVLDIPEQLFAVEGRQFMYVVDTTDREGDQPGQRLTFSDDSDLFDIIESTGQIVFTPTDSMAGEHNVTITVTDGEHTVEGYLNLIIYRKKAEERDTTTASYVVLAAELALVAVGALYIVNFRRRIRREDAARQEKAEED